jgi:alpha-glucosidase (family GH31 glycosyl hydrolase)
MDWHLVDVDPRYGSGWTGYTFNRELFPDPRGFLAALHERGLATSLNVHPADGVRAHEDAYPRIAERMGIDPSTELPVNFDPTDPAFVAAYLEELHHPLEAEGVDFWWLDWQQGAVTKVPGLDPLWLLNHFHYLDSARDGKRPLTFSRYAGIGSHRYPVGFSGDTVISWASLQFQPEFTASASNAGYGWWSHDVGGHFHGVRDDELATRWVQLGVFSPILRLHSGDNAFTTKEPWRFGEVARRVMTEALRLRDSLVPYLVTMGRRATEAGEPLVQPMYYDHPWDEAAYSVPNQFMFGTELLVAPITTPTDPRTRMASTKAWLPEGDWVDVFTGLAYRGGRTIELHRSLDSVPALVRLGTILPLGTRERLQLHVFAGGDGSFTLSEDDDDAVWAETTLTYRGGELTVEGGPARRYELVLHGFAGVESAELDGERVEVRDGRFDLGERDGARVRLTGDLSLADDDVRRRVFELLDRAQVEIVTKNAIRGAVDEADTPDRAMLSLLALGAPEPLVNAVGELLLAR